MMGGYIPDDLLVPILLGLTVKSLVRFRRVCKSWNQIISTKSFINSHIIHHKFCYIFFDHSSYYTANLINTQTYSHILETHNPKQCYGPPSFHLDVCPDFHYLKVYGIGNGLLCLSDAHLDENSPIYLWNPIIRKAKKLPGLGTTNHYNGVPNLCFGNHNMDCKVVTIARWSNLFYIYIFSLSSDRWCLKTRDAFDVGPGNLDFLQYPNSRLVNGVAYFVTSTSRKIICFDLNDEVIRVVSFPKRLGKDFSVKEMQGTIALMEFSIQFSRVVIWALRKNYIWEEMPAIRLSSCFPLGLINNGKALVLRTSNHFSNQFMLLNLENGRLLDFKFQDRFKTAEDRKDVWRIDSFVGSLLLLDQNNIELPDEGGSEYSDKTASFKLHKWYSRWDPIEIAAMNKRRNKTCSKLSISRLFGRH